MNIEGAKAILENDKTTSFVVDEANPLVCATYADCLRVKGEYYLASGDIDKSSTSMVEFALWYSKVDDAAKEKECLNTVMHIHLTHNVSPQSTLEKLSGYYQRKTKFKNLICNVLRSTAIIATTAAMFTGGSGSVHPW